MKFGIVLFPGSNCERDMFHVLSQVLQAEVREIWHKETRLDGFNTEDCIVLPGGFSYGDYLRTGAIARFSPVMEAVLDFARRGGKVFGVCNGFQILCEAHLLPGALLRNQRQQYVCENIYLRPDNPDSLLTRHLSPDSVLRIPIAHGEGRYFAPPDVLEQLEANRQVLFRYCSANGELSEETNPNGSLNHIAGVRNAEGNVMGMMPHPERAAEEALGNTDGRLILESLLQAALV
jgi:phosphoribosylformylglycinamidine synthase subunit PurQ / glutaminase